LKIFVNKDSSNQNYLNKLIIVIFGLSGMTALIYEIVWIRPLSLIFGTTIFAISIIIAAFLSGLALGSWLAGRYIDKLENPLKYYGFIEIGIGLFGLLLISLFTVLPGFYLDIYHLTFPNTSLFFILQFVLAFSLILIPTTLMGATMPIILKAYSRDYKKMGRDVGRLYSVNNIGAVLGTIAAGFLLIPLLGVQTSIMITAIINIAIGLIILGISKSVNKKIVVSMIVIAILVGSFSSYDSELIGFGMWHHAKSELDMELVYGFLERQDTMFHKQSLYSTVNVNHDKGLDVMRINSKIQCTNGVGVVGGMERLGSIPYGLFEHNNQKKPSSALNIGLGCGYTSKWLSEHVETTTLEIDQVVVEASSKFFVDDIDHNLVIDDARNWLTRNDVKYDIITAQPNDPFNVWYLFTYEFISLTDSRLSENGILAYWVPVFYMDEDDFDIMYNTFHSVYPYVYIYKMETGLHQLLFLGSQNPLEIDDSTYYLLNHEKIPLTKTVLNTDDKPVLEFSSAVNVYKKDPHKPIIENIIKWIKNN
jgi:spermidine synthase